MNNPQPDQEPDAKIEQPDAEKAPVVLNPSYRRAKPFVLTDEVRRAIAGAVAEIDLEQAEIVRKLTPAQRFRQAMSMINAAERATAYRLRQREPELSEIEALRIVRSGLLEYELRNHRA